MYVGKPGAIRDTAKKPTAVPKIALRSSFESNFRPYSPLKAERTTIQNIGKKNVAVCQRKYTVQRQARRTYRFRYPARRISSSRAGANANGLAMMNLLRSRDEMAHASPTTQKNGFGTENVLRKRYDTVSVMAAARTPYAFIPSISG